MATHSTLTKTPATPATTNQIKTTTFHQLRAWLLPLNIGNVTEGGSGSASGVGTGAASGAGVFIAVSCIVAIILAIATDAVHAKSPDEATLLQIRTNCRQQTASQLSDSEYKIIADHKLLNAETTAATTPKSLQCFCLCYLNATGAYKNNQPSAEYLSDQLPTIVKDAQKAATLAGKCGKPTGADDCEKAFNFVLCMAKEAKIYLY